MVWNRREIKDKKSLQPPLQHCGMAALWHCSTAALQLSFYWKASERRSYFRLDKESWSFLQISGTVQFLTGCILSRAFIDKSFCQKVVPRKSSASVLSQICLSVKCHGVQQCPKKWKIITSSNLSKQIWKSFFPSSSSHFQILYLVQFFF